MVIGFIGAGLFSGWLFYLAELGDKELGGTSETGDNLTQLCCKPRCMEVYY